MDFERMIISMNPSKISCFFKSLSYLTERRRKLFWKHQICLRLSTRIIVWNHLKQNIGLAAPKSCLILYLHWFKLLFMNVTVSYSYTHQQKPPLCKTVLLIVPLAPWCASLDTNSLLIKLTGLFKAPDALCAFSGWGLIFPSGFLSNRFSSAVN